MAALLLFASLLIMTVGRVLQRVIIEARNQARKLLRDQRLHREAGIRPGGGYLHRGLAA
jgi:hypothetical protein